MTELFTIVLLSAVFALGVVVGQCFTSVHADEIAEEPDTHWTSTVSCGHCGANHEVYGADMTIAHEAADLWYERHECDA